MERQKRGRSPTREGELINANANKLNRRKKRSRWGTETNIVTNFHSFPLSICATMTPEQVEAYVLNFRIEEISIKLRINDVIPKDRERSPSPAPVYDASGKRINTRDVRLRKKLEDERHKLIEYAMSIIPAFKPPVDYKRTHKTQEKVYIPINDYPEVNFIGLLIGPRGNTLKKMEQESGAKIAIRGKGSIKEGKGRTDLAHNFNLDEDLHCLVIAESEAKIQKAVDLINNVIETAASIPEGQNDLKRHQLRELAALNGTLRDDENLHCQICGDVGHKKYDCPTRKNVTTNIVCPICGNSGHFARDCKDRPENYRDTTSSRLNNQNSAIAEKEFQQFMLELEGGGSSTSRIDSDSTSSNHSRRAIEYKNTSPEPSSRLNEDNHSSNDIPPWKRSSIINSNRDAQNNSNIKRNNNNINSSAALPPWKRNGAMNMDSEVSSIPPWKQNNHIDVQQKSQWNNDNNNNNNYNQNQNQNYNSKNFNETNSMDSSSSANSAPWRKQGLQQDISHVNSNRSQNQPPLPDYNQNETNSKFSPPPPNPPVNFVPQSSIPSSESIPAPSFIPSPPFPASNISAPSASIPSPFPFVPGGTKNSSIPPPPPPGFGSSSFAAPSLPPGLSGSSGSLPSMAPPPPGFNVKTPLHSSNATSTFTSLPPPPPGLSGSVSMLNTLPPPPPPPGIQIGSSSNASTNLPPPPSSTIPRAPGT